MSYLRISFIFAIVAICVAFYLNFGQSVKSIVVNTEFGKIKGYEEYSRDSKSYWSFKGVPFAQPPVGNLRFKNPEPIKPWDEILDAHSLPESCLQFDQIVKRHVGSEDCLYLNMYTPKITSDELEKLPVLVFIHGGSFLYGGSNFYQPQYFMDFGENGAILVIVQYRVGVFGFLNTEDESISPNLGLKDQLEALKMIKTIIGNFGGDSSRITLFGQSAGAACVQHLVLSNQTNDLISSAIIQSGSAASGWGFIKSPRKQAFRVGEAVGCSNMENNSKKLAKCLQSVDGRKFTEFHQNDEEFWSQDKFGPSMEHPTEESKKSAILLESPHEILRKGNYKRIPLLIGNVEMEGAILANTIMENVDRVNQDWNKMSSHLDIYNSPEKLMAVRKMYFGSRKKFSEEDLNTFTQIISESNFFKGTRQTAMSNLNYNNSSSTTDKKNPIFLYFMTYSGRQDMTEIGMCHLIRATTNLFYNSFIPLEINLLFEIIRIRMWDFVGYPVQNFGMCHADCLKYMFMQHPLMKIDTASPNYEFSKYLVKLWVNFAKTGKPAENWEPASDSNSLKYFEISGVSTSSMINDPMNTKRLQFWEDIYS